MKTRAFLLSDALVAIAITVMITLIVSASSRVVLNYERQKEAIFKDLAYYEEIYDTIPCIIQEEETLEDESIMDSY